MFPANRRDSASRLPRLQRRRRPTPACTLKLRAAIIERKTMTTYIALFNLTEAGIKAAVARLRPARPGGR